MSEESPIGGFRLDALLAESGMAQLDERVSQRFKAYLSLILRWNARVNLTSVRDEEGILSRHFVESIACARALPSEISTLLDFGSGAGFPGIPIALCRPEIAVTLAESQGKKAAFLAEACRTLGISATIHPDRAERIGRVFDCVVLRAVDKMTQAVTEAAALVKENGWLALMTTAEELKALQSAAGSGFNWGDTVALPRSDSRILALGRKISSPA